MAKVDGMKWKWAWSVLLLSGLGAGTACDGGMEADGDPAGGGPSTGGSPLGVGGTGGGSGGSPGAGGGDFACNPTLGGTGGGIGLLACRDWLDEGGSLDLTCSGMGGQGGFGGQSAGHDPALKRICESESKPGVAQNHPVYYCLEPLTHDPCAPDHETEVIACITQPPPCNIDLAAVGCRAYMNDCATLEAGTCYWGLTATYHDSDYVEECFDEPVEDETCDARFLRCAWGL